ncbi:hypothetical protein BDR26DRAFT_122434 [Obelidium mucronatum]|nr:hypothetical protein BDR26DRAFT_122434 [Obelidium mucronatum]
MSFFSKLSAKANSAASKLATQVDGAAKSFGSRIDEAVAKQKETTPTGQVFNQDFSGECQRAATIITDFIGPQAVADAANGGLDHSIPGHVITNAKGLAILQVVRAGISISGRYGSGVVIARLPDGSWSAPSVVKTAGLGVGFQIGADITDFVMILNTAESVKAFSQGGDIKVGGSLSVAAGPIGRSAEASTSITNVSPIFSYSKSKGLFAGASLDGSAVMEGKEINEKYYGRLISAQEILSGTVERPAVAEGLYKLGILLLREYISNFTHN